MKKLLPIVLSLSFLLQSFGYLLIFADYQLNKEYISKNLCENRSRPELKCHGKCQLCKKLKNEENKDNKGLPGSKSLKQDVLFSSKKSDFQFSNISLISGRTYNYMSSLSSLHKLAVFHPPLV